VTASKNTSAPSATNGPQHTSNAAAGTFGEIFGSPLIMAIVGMVGVGLVL